MKSKKILIISIIIVITIIIILGAVTFAMVYTKTDVFKTDEQLFYKYFIEFGESFKDLANENLEKYLQKEEITPYESNGELAVKVDIPELEKTKVIDLNFVNDFNVTFSGKTNKIDRLSEQSIKLNYSDDVVFPIEYRQTEDLYGITSNLILNKYIAVKNENLEELIKGNGNIEIANKISQNSLNIQDIKNEIQKFKEIILRNVNKNNFSKSEENFILTLNENEAAKILIEILEEAEKSQYIEQDRKQEIRNMINEFKIKEYTQEDCLKIIINKSGKLVIQIKDEINLNIQKRNNLVLFELITQENRKTLEIRKNRESKRYRI